MGQGAKLSKVVVSAGDWPQPGPSGSSGVSVVQTRSHLQAIMGVFCTPGLVWPWLWSPRQGGLGVMF